MMQCIAILLYILAPREYSWWYNVVVLVAFILNFVLMLRKQRFNLLSYTTLLFIVFFFVNFAYPVFIYPYDPTFILQFRYSFSPDYINKGTALCFCAFSMFVGGYSSRVVPLKRFRYDVLYNRYQFFTILAYVVLLYNLYLIVPQLGMRYGDAQIPFQSGSLFVMMECTLASICCYIHRDSIKNNWRKFIHILLPHLISSAVFCVFILMLGSREYVIVLILLYVFLFTKYVKPLSAWKLALGVCVGMIGLYYISQVRNFNNQQSIWGYKSWQSESVSSVWNLASDLIINNRNVYVGMQYVAEHGYSFGVNYLPNLLSPIPLLPSIFSMAFFEQPVVEFTSQQILTNYTRDELGHNDLDYELGTNCVVDIYMGFGVVGVIILFFLLGKLIRCLETAEDNLPMFCAYVILFTTVIFFCRSSFFGPLRNLVWSYLMCLIMLRRYQISAH